MSKGLVGSAGRQIGNAMRPPPPSDDQIYLNAIVSEIRLLLDCVAWVSRRSQSSQFAVSSREADVFRTSAFQHSVQCVHGNRDLGRSAPIGSGS